MKAFSQAGEGVEPPQAAEGKRSTSHMLENTAKQRRVSMKKHLCLFILLLLSLALPCALADATVPQEVLDASAEVRSAAVPAAGGIW